MGCSAGRAIFLYFCSSLSPFKNFPVDTGFLHSLKKAPGNPFLSNWFSGSKAPASIRSIRAPVAIKHAHFPDPSRHSRLLARATKTAAFKSSTVAHLTSHLLESTRGFATFPHEHKFHSCNSAALVVPSLGFPKRFRSHMILEGHAGFVAGKLVQRTCQDDDGNKRQTVEIEGPARRLGPSVSDRSCREGINRSQGFIRFSFLERARLCRALCLGFSALAGKVAAPSAQRGDRPMTERSWACESSLSARSSSTPSRLKASSSDGWDPGSHTGPASLVDWPRSVGVM
jgi:hypothetical protein